MDPKLSGLDPKLQDAYDRVMNGPSTLPGQTPAAAPTQSNTQPNQPPQMDPMPTPPAPIQPTSSGFQTTPPAPSSLNLDSTYPQAPFNPNSQALNNEPTPHADPTPAISSTMAFNASNPEINKGTSNAKSSKNMLPIIIGVFIPIFLVVYAIVWMVIFNVKLPFIG